MGKPEFIKDGQDVLCVVFEDGSIIESGDGCTLTIREHYCGDRSVWYVIDDRPVEIYMHLMEHLTTIKIRKGE